MTKFMNYIRINAYIYTDTNLCIHIKQISLYNKYMYI